MRAYYNKLSKYTAYWFHRGRWQPAAGVNTQEPLENRAQGKHKDSHEFTDTQNRLALFSACFNFVKKYGHQKTRSLQTDLRMTRHYRLTGNKSNGHYNLFFNYRLTNISVFQINWHRDLLFGTIRYQKKKTFLIVCKKILFICVLLWPAMEGSAVSSLWFYSTNVQSHLSLVCKFLKKYSHFNRNQKFWIRV